MLLLETSTGRDNTAFGFCFLGSSPHPSTPDEDDSQTELLIAEEKLSPEDEGQIMPRYEKVQVLHTQHTYIHVRFASFIIEFKILMKLVILSFHSSCVAL